MGHASGQKENYNKSLIMFSSNIKNDLANKIARTIGMQQTHDMGKYLGVQTIHVRTTKSLFNLLLERINVKLDG